MAFRLKNYVLRGEIRNSQRNSVSGWLEVLRSSGKGNDVASEPRLVMLSFAGNLLGELAGRDFRFEVREQDLPNPRPVLDEQFHNDQIGPMGDSLYRMVRVPLIPIEEFCMALERGETPPEEQRASIYLEWYSQNGRVVLELLDPILEFAGQYDRLADPEPEPVPDSEDVAPPSITAISLDDDGVFDINSVSPPDAEDDDDPFGLFPKGLSQQISQSSLDAESADESFEHDDQLPWSEDEPRKLRRWDEVIPGIDPETKALYEQWDEVTHGTKNEPLTWLFESPLCLPKPDHVLDEQQAWNALHSLLAAMALRGVAFDMCPHFTAMQAYRLLIEELLPEAGVHPNLVATGWIQHYSSWESCKECEAEFDEEYERRHPKEDA
ncbi:MAG: hypothetical protein U0936_04875 [Planctomycetaceae bacterium]